SLEKTYTVRTCFLPNNLKIARHTGNTTHIRSVVTDEAPKTDKPRTQLTHPRWSCEDAHHNPCASARARVGNGGFRRVFRRCTRPPSGRSALSAHWPRPLWPALGDAGHSYVQGFSTSLVRSGRKTPITLLHLDETDGVLRADLVFDGIGVRKLPHRFHFLAAVEVQAAPLTERVRCGLFTHAPGRRNTSAQWCRRRTSGRPPCPSRRTSVPPIVSSHMMFQSCAITYQTWSWCSFSRRAVLTPCPGRHVDLAGEGITVAAFASKFYVHGFDRHALPVFVASTADDPHSARADPAHARVGAEPSRLVLLQGFVRGQGSRPVAVQARWGGTRGRVQREPRTRRKTIVTAGWTPALGEVSYPSPFQDITRGSLTNRSPRS